MTAGRLAAALAVGAAVAGAPLVRAEEPLSLAASLELAALRNETAGIAAARLERAAALRRQAVAQLVPALTLTGTYTRRANEVTRTVDGEEITVQALDAFSSQAVVESTLFDLRALPLIGSARAGLEAQRLESRELERALSFDVADAFYTVLGAEQLLAAAEQRVEVARSTAEEAAIRLEAGLAARNELTRTRLELATAELAVTEAANGVRAARLVLGYLIGESIGERPLIAAPAAPPVERDPERLVARASAASAELAALEGRVEQARLLVRASRFGLAPSLDLRGLYRTTNEAGLSGNESDWNVAVNLTWELFDGGDRAAQSRILAAEAAEAELALAQRRRSLALAVETALADLETAEAGLAQAEVQSDVADQNADEVRERFQQGLATGLELADALAERFAAASERARQEYARRLAQLALERALGDWPGGDPRQPAPPSGAAEAPVAAGATLP